MPRWLRGHGGYALAAVAEIARWTPVGMKVEISGPSGQWANDKGFDTERPAETEGGEALQGPATLVAFANASSYGHGMKMAPRARLDDGRLDVCFVRQTTKRRLLRFFPSVFSGGHLGLPEVEYRQTEWLRVESERPMAVYADGEYVCETPVEVRVVPKGLKVIVTSGHRAIG
jgi:diacylglycerol kinase family enzyme